MKKRIRAAIGAAVACALFGSAAMTAVADDGGGLDGRIVDVYEASNGMSFEKVSHPESGLRTADGVVDYVGGGAVSASDAGQGDRGQSYSYAAESYGDWVYIGTMYGGLGVQAILKNGLASNMGMSAEAATELIQTLYSGHMYLGEPDGDSAGGILFKFNVKTGETKILMSQSAGIDGGVGVIPTFRSAFKMNGKLYFEGMVMDTSTPGLTAQEIKTAMAMQNGFPCIYEVDPEDGDRLTRVYDSVDVDGFRQLVQQGVFTSTRAIGSFGNTLVAGDLKPTEDGGAAYLVASDTPGVPGSYKVIADMDSFDGLPAIHRSDVNGGGGIYQVQEFNGKLYVVVCTGKRDTRNEETGTLRSFAIYVGENTGDPTEKDDWHWRPLVGDTAKGAKYHYGMDAGRVSAGACTLQVYGDYLYIGDYNDVSSALQGFATNMDFVTQGTNLDQSINLYRMDADEHVEMLVGDPNDTFPDGGSTGLGSGYGNHMNQYTWQTTVHEGRMYLSTMNTTTLLEPMAQFTNGDILHLTKEEWAATLGHLRTFLELVLKRDAVAAHDLDTTDASAAPSADDPDALVDWALDQAQDRAEAAMTASADGTAAAGQSVTLTDKARQALVAGLTDGSIVPGSLEDMETAAALVDANDRLGALETALDERASAAFVEDYGEVLSLLDRLQMPDALRTLYETIVKLASQRNMQAFLKSLPYLSSSKRGFNLFEITDNGTHVSIETVADDGFGDPFNHGLRVFVNTDDYLLVGTANPFYGTQLWRVANTVFPVHVEAGEGGTASADPTAAVAPGTKVTLSATPDDGYRFTGWDILRGDVEIGDDQTFTMPQGSVRVRATFTRTAASEAQQPAAPDAPDATQGTAAEPAGGDAGHDGSEGPLAATGASVTGLFLASLLAGVLGTALAISRKRRA
ncbi:InlB B-repeat-containing protein [Bifidobacterium cuniculi]|uniref:InlB B-repeat-containing protein n=1 Tax=Bifidobacterium cuniculi TaxID=1688 RepID=UPI000529E59E|nr:hypothetical protein [Bifidobacterium cuniculi]